MNRRDFLSHSLLTAGLLAAPAPLAQALAAPNKRLKRFGFISGIIRAELEKDWRAALRQAAAHGFTEIETGKHLGNSVREFLDFCDSVGLAVRVGGMPFKPEEADQHLDRLQELGVKTAVVYWPWKVSAPFRLQDCQVSAEILNQLGEKCRQRGILFGWHNHEKEFAPMEEGLPFDYLMAHTQPELVRCQMDVFWVAKGNADPVAYLQKYPGRYAALHLKDMTKDDRQTFECVGSGRLDFPAILREATRQGIEYFSVEQDKVEDGLACLAQSGAYLKTLRF
jgi:sugar phosphate isomerase/epimerase